ncbi:MAG: phenylalanine--tRNA ligase subunit alpha [Pirellulaceae bacterium]|nr:phenylalanine--tRNA ligase subunit alpha [Pirellulaceae bacterium]
MALVTFTQRLEDLKESANADFQKATTQALVEEARVKYLGAKNGLLKEVQKELGKISKEEKPLAGKALNETKQALQKALDEAESQIRSGVTAAGDQPLFDPTLPGTSYTLGHIHPITQTISELSDIMGRLGFSVVGGPEVEDEDHNFNALNIPQEHPARDPLDNFYLSFAQETNKTPMLLRSQTSTVQIRVMEKTKPPIRIVSLGRVYRPDTADATHYPMFHQMEGLYVDEKVTMADLKTVMHLFAKSYLGEGVKVRFRPSFFPFTEPSVETDFYWNGKWVEYGGAGMVDPNVFRAVGYDPEEVTGFAFGLGVERLCMRRHNVTDIRDLYQNDVQFLRQF